MERNPTGARAVDEPRGGAGDVRELVGLEVLHVVGEDQAAAGAVEESDLKEAGCSVARPR